MAPNKKTKSKSSKSPAPATKIKRPAAGKKRAKPAAAVAAPAAPARAVPAPASMPAPKVKASALTLRATVVARIDVGFGNALYLRGEGAGLSWDKGLVMNCVSDDEWEITLPESAAPVEFKFLINDLTWSAGPNFSVLPGGLVTAAPEF